MIKGWMIFAIMSGGDVHQIPYETGNNQHIIYEKEECVSAVKIITKELGSLHGLEIKCLPFLAHR